jgi:arylsulfatase A-like enzyme/tetratricopeptide (TPR) repeat protein
VKARRSFVVAALLVAAVAVALMIWRGRSSGHTYAPGSLAGGNVLLITLDTTRADHLPAYGYKGVSTPGLDRLAADSVIFDDAIAHAPLTLPSHTSLLTGQLPIAHGVRDNEGYFVDPKIPTLAEILKAKGYATSAFVSAFVLDSQWGLARGFDTYFDEFNQFQEVNRDLVQRRAEETGAAAERWLTTAGGKPFFCWIHFYDPHDPYDPPEPFASRYAANRYDGEIAYMDSAIDRLLAKITELKLDDRTLVVVTGDHGEGLGEHGESTHGMFLYRTTLHVPLLIRIPGGASRHVADVVRHVDVAPTILDLLGLPVAPSMQGASLLPVIAGTERGGRTAYSESLYAQRHFGWSPLQSLTDKTYDLIQSPKPELFDHVNDRGQTRNLISPKSATAESMKEQLDELVASLGRTDLPAAAPLDPDTEARLRALGYVGSSATSTPESLKIDPKDKLGVVEAVARSMAALQQRDFGGALNGILPVTQSEPGILEAHYIAGTAFAYSQMYDQALDQLFKVLAIKPDHTISLAMIGTAYEGKGDLKQAEIWYLKALEHDKEHGFTMVKLANVYRRMGQTAKADSFFARALAPVEAALATTNEPKPRSRLYGIRAEMYFAAGRAAEAATDLKAAIALTPAEPVLHFNLAQAAERNGDVASAIANYQEEIRIAPQSIDAYLNLGMLYFRLQRFDDAIQTYQAFRAAAPADPRPGVLLAEAYLRAGKNLDEALRLAQTGLQQMGEAIEIWALIGAIEQRRGNAEGVAQAQARIRALQGR